ncbi:19191_t:CDS:2 [Gigaspora rosea]|nr:19191_t:CDS:2 [Gigaspora rosea]
MDNTSITLRHFIFSEDIGEALVPCTECNLSQLNRNWKYCHITRPIVNCLPIQVDSKKRWHADPENFRQYKPEKYRPKIELNIPGKHLIMEKFCKALGSYYGNVTDGINNSMDNDANGNRDEYHNQHTRGRGNGQ